MATPRKSWSKLCCLCGSSLQRYLINLGKNKALTESYVETIDLCIGIRISEDVKDFTYICTPCRNKLLTFKSFKVASQNHFYAMETNVTRQKREHFTPESEKKTTKRTNVTTTADWLIKSVEKLKIDKSSKGPIKTGKRLPFSSENLILEPSGDDLVESDYAIPLALVESNEHNYASPSTNSILREQAIIVMKDSGLTTTSENVFEKLHVADVTSIVSSLQEGSLKQASFQIFKCLPLMRELKQFILKDLEAGMSARFDQKKSQLYARSPENLSNNDLFSAILMEIKTNTPFLLDILTICCKSKTDQQKLTMISTIFGMFMQSRNRKASAVQRVYTSLCIRFHADNELLNRLNIIHLTLTGSSKTVIIKEFADYHRNAIVSEVKSGKDGKINGDNLDIKVTPTYERLQSKRQDLHLFASDWTPDRMNVSGVTNTGTCGDPNSVTVQSFIVTKRELVQFRDSTKLLVGRELVKNFKCFQWMRKLLPDHIPHEYSDEMCKVSTPYIMPILLKNETKYTDCIGIMDSYEKQAKTWYQEAGRESDFEDMEIPIGGDQLTRVRLQGAKLCRKGTHTKEEEFGHLTPIVVELFHTSMDFLEKMCKKFLKIDKAKDQGTLGNLRVVIQRNSINGQVKSRYMAHEDFVITAGNAYLVETILEHFGMDDKHSLPTVNMPHVNVEKFETTRRQAEFDKTMDLLMDKLIHPFSMLSDQEEENVLLTVHSPTTQYDVQAGISTVNGKKVLSLHFNIGQPRQPELIMVQLQPEMLSGGKAVSLTLPSCKIPVTIKRKVEKEDDLMNYVLNFLQWYFLMINMKDAMAEGDLHRTNINLKMMVPIFYMHSAMSKYLIECINYILQTEILLSPQMSLRVRAGSYVNKKGRKGGNKPADIEKENQVKYLKDLIRGLGANKSEQSIIIISKAGPVVKKIVKNFDELTGIKKHLNITKQKSSADDMEALAAWLRKLRPMKKQPGRTLMEFRGITANPFEKLDKTKFSNQVMKTANRLQRNQPVEVAEDDED